MADHFIWLYIRREGEGEREREGGRRKEGEGERERERGMEGEGEGEGRRERERERDGGREREREREREGRRERERRERGRERKEEHISDINILNHYMKECTIPSKGQHPFAVTSGVHFTNPSMQQMKGLTVHVESVHSGSSTVSQDPWTHNRHTNMRPMRREAAKNAC